MSYPRAILVVEDSVVTSVAIGRTMERALPDCKVVRAQSCFEARLLLRVYQFALFVLDIHLPDGSGLDLVPTITTRDPGARIIILTGDTRPENRDLSNAFGIRHFLSKPFLPQSLTQAAQDSLTESEPEPSNYFTATLTRHSMLDILQLKCLTRVSTRLEITPNGDPGTSAIVDFNDGEIVHAAITLSDSDQPFAEGEPALETILGWTQGHVEEVLPPASIRQTIHQTSQSLLLQMLHNHDERLAGRLVAQN